MSCAPFCTMEKSEGRYKGNSALTFHLDRGIIKLSAIHSLQNFKYYVFIRAPYKVFLRIILRFFFIFQ